jgi:predicted ATP-dependent protease
MDVGDYSFARPTRITARSGIGADGVVNIEREAELSGATHSKGVLILGGYLIGAYAAEHPLALSGRLTFEQTYSEVEGDSASSAELYALLSSLSGLPVHQGIAVTGSVDQRGAIQSVGAVTRKVEGHYAVCAAQGLTGEQGVIIPSANTRHLMLRRDVMDAVRRGAFHVWPVSSIDEGLRILTGVEAGLRRPDGSYEEGSVHALVQARLAGYSRRLAELTGRAGSLGEPAAHGREAVHATDATG